MDLASSARRHVELDAAELAALRARMRPRALRPRQLLLARGRPVTFVAFVERGCLRVYERDAAGKQRTFQFAEAGSWTGDLGGFVSGRPSRYDIEALEGSAVLLLGRAALERAYAELPKLERLFRILYQDAYVACQDRVVSAMAQSPAERYERFLREHPALSERVADRHIASYLGITPEALSRIRARRSARRRRS